MRVCICFSRFQDFTILPESLISFYSASHSVIAILTDNLRAVTHGFCYVLFIKDPVFTVTLLSRVSLGELWFGEDISFLLNKLVLGKANVLKSLCCFPHMLNCLPTYLCVCLSTCIPVCLSVYYPPTYLPPFLLVWQLLRRESGLTCNRKVSDLIPGSS